MKKDICTINLEGKDRQTIYWDTEDKLLHTDFDDSECYGVECETYEDACSLAYDLWGKTDWSFEWVEQ